MKRQALSLQETLELFGDLAVKPRRDAIQEFDDGHFAAEPAPNRTEFEPDIARSHHEQALRYGFERQRAGRRDDLLFVDGDAGQLRHVRTRCDDDVFRLDGARGAVGKGNDDLAWLGDPRAADDS